MESKLYRSLHQKPERLHEITVPVFIKQAASSGANRVRYIRIPAAMKVVGVDVVADGTLASSNKTVTVTQGYVSAGSASALGSDLTPMNATDVAALGVTVTATTNPALFTATVATTLVPVVATEDSNYVASGKSDETATINTLRARAEMKADDVLVVTVPKANDSATPYYRFLIRMIPGYTEDTTAAAVA